MLSLLASGYNNAPPSRDLPYTGLPVWVAFMVGGLLVGMGARLWWESSGRAWWRHRRMRSV